MKSMLKNNLLLVVLCLIGAVTVSKANTNSIGNVTIADEWLQESLPIIGGNGIQQVVPVLATVDGGELHGSIPNAQTLITAAALRENTLGIEAVSGVPAIVELARALKHDPDLIYEYVHDNIEYYPIWGVQKGAEGALIDKSGTAFDQAILMVELLRQSGYAASYQKGTIQVTGEQAQAWFGFERAQICSIIKYVGHGQIPIKTINASQAVSCPGGNASLLALQIDHIWVKVNIEGIDYIFDPSFKALESKEGIDLVAAAGYDTAAYLASARNGATLNTNYVQNLNRTNIRNNLTNYSAQLINHIRNNIPSATLSDIVGGNSVRPLSDSFALRQTTLPYRAEGAAITEWPHDIPDAYRPTLHVEYQGVSEQFTSDALYGKRLSIFFNTENQPELRLDGALMATGSAATPGTHMSIKFAIRHAAYATEGINQEFTQNIQVGGSYVISNAWGPVSRAMLDRHQTLLNINIQAGHESASEAVLGESLSAIAYAWLAEVSASAKLIDQITGTVTLFHHQVGIAGQNQSPYVDLPGNLLSTISKTGDFNASGTAFWLKGTHSSIFESLAVEQLAGVSAVSTVKLLDIANHQGLPIYSANTSNYASNVEPFLDASCSAGDRDTFQQAIDLSSRLVIPGRCDIGEGNWRGTGYYAIGNNKASILAAISGGLAGGFATNEQPPAELVNIAKAPTNHQSVFEIVNDFSNTFGDPIDIFTGNYLFSHQDISVGNGKFPYSLSLQRFYNSGSYKQASVLGKGWTHNFEVTAKEGVDGFQGMGEDSPIDAAASIIEIMVAADMLKDSQNPLDKIVITAIGQRWFADQLLNNTVIIKNGQSSEVFVKLPNGEYNAPPGKSAKLLKHGDGHYRYQTLDKTTIDFDHDGNIVDWTHPGGMQAHFSYTEGQLAKVENSLGRALQFNYANEQLVQVLDGQGRIISYAQDEHNDLIEFTDTVGEKTHYQYDQPGRMTRIFYPTRPADPFIINHYDSQGRVQAQTNANGEVWGYYFAGSRSEEQDPMGGSKIRYQDRFGNPTRLIDERGRETKHQYDGQNRLVQTTFAEGNGMHYTYDDATCATNSGQCSHNIAEISITAKPGSPLAPVTRSFSYHPEYGKLLSATDARQATTDYAYYPATGQLLSITLPPDQHGHRAHQSFTYDYFSSALGGNFSLLSAQTDTINATESTTTRYAYNPDNHFVTRTVTVDAGGLNISSTSGYDGIGNLTHIDGPRIDVNDTAFFSYDNERRLTTSTDPLGNIRKNGYDADGQLIRVAAKIEQQWQVSCTDYTPTRQLAKVWGPSLTAADDQCPAQTAPIAVQDYQYDRLDRLDLMSEQLPLEEGGNRSSKIQYYADGKPQLVTRDLGGSLQQTTANYLYTANGQTAGIRDAKGNLTRYEYDGFGRLEYIHYPDPEQIGQASATDYEQFIYDANGNLITERRRSGDSVIHVYDLLNRRIEKQLLTEDIFLLRVLGMNNLPIQTEGGASNSNDDYERQYSRYDYDLLGRLIHQSSNYSSEDSSRYEYDLAGRLVSVTQEYTSISRLSLTINYRYDLAGNRTRMTYPDGFAIDYIYDAANRLQNIVDPAIGILATYQYDSLYQRKQLTLANGTVTHYHYDLQMRLDALTHDFAGTANDVTLDYHYNQAGQIRTQNTSNQQYDWDPSNLNSTSYQTNGLNQNTLINGSNQWHDGNGNLFSDEYTELKYDPENRLAEIRNANLEVLYGYNAQGQRILTDHNATLHQHFYDGDDLIAEYDEDSRLTRRYLHGPTADEPLLEYQYDAQGTLQASHWYYANHQGSTIATADNAGNVQQIYTYSPYGIPGEQGPAIFRYTGQVWDAETQLYYYKARYYSPENRRFLSPDPAGYVDSMNLYAYVVGDPVNLVDPSGMIVAAAVNSAGQDIMLAGNVLGNIAATEIPGNQSFLNALHSDNGIDASLFLVQASLEVAAGVVTRGVGAATKRGGDFVDLTTPARRRHILDGDRTGGGHRPSTGKPGKSEFPAGRSDDSIIHDISDIATDPTLRSRVGRGGRTITDGTRNGVDIRVIQERNGDIVTGFPTNTPRNPR